MNNRANKEKRKRERDTKSIYKKEEKEKNHFKIENESVCK